MIEIALFGVRNKTDMQTKKEKEKNSINILDLRAEVIAKAIFLILTPIIRNAESEIQKKNVIMLIITR